MTAPDLTTPAEPDRRFHPVASIFPLMAGEDLRELAEDIKAHGLREPIWLHADGRIIDGRNRFRACEIGGAAPSYRTYEGDDLVAFVVSLNLRRRHLNDEQRRIVAAKVVTMEQGRPSETSQSANITRETAANLLSVDVAGVDRARKVLKQGAPELVAAVERGETSVNAASAVAELPQDEQREIVARGPKEIIAKAKAILAERAGQRRAERIERLIELSHRNAQLPERKYPIIYADPPWQYEHIISVSREIEDKYPTMTLDEICALAVRDLATDDALLYLWTTTPMLEGALKVIAAWGFEYRTNLAWDKEIIGMGYYARGQHELLLVARRGNPPLPAPSDVPPSLYRERRREHSAKPAWFAEMIERCYPRLPKIELFCRGAARPGWAAWGNQAGEAA